VSPHPLTGNDNDDMSDGWTTLDNKPEYSTSTHFHMRSCSAPLVCSGRSAKSHPCDAGDFQLQRLTDDHFVYTHVCFPEDGLHLASHLWVHLNQRLSCVQSILHFQPPLT
jgi:hypothetical protein